MPTAVLFDGKQRIIPGAYGRVVVRGTTGRGSVVPDVIAIIGPSTGGEPQTPLRFTSPADAREALRSGDLLDAMNFAWAPSADFAGANEIIAVRATPAVQGTITLNNIAAAGVMTATTVDWGAWVNNIRFKIEAGSRDVDDAWTGLINDVGDIDSSVTTITYDTGVGTLPANGVIRIGSEIIQYTAHSGTSVAGALTGCKRAAYPARSGVAAAHLNNAAIALLDLPGVPKITIQNQLDPLALEIGDNLGQGITLRYTGSGTPAAVTVTVTGGLAVTLAATVTGASSDDFSLNLTLTQNDTLQKVANAIDTLANWEASLKAPGSTPSSDLDPVSALEAKLASAAPLQLLRIGAAITAWAVGNSQYVRFADIGTPTTAPANVAYGNFSNGSDGTENSAAWTTALESLEGELDVLLVVPATGNLSYQTLAAAHVAARFDEGLLQRMLTGSDVADTVQNALDAAANFASKRVSFCYPGIKRAASDGTVTTYGGWAVAAALAGLTVGLARSRALTGITLLGAGPEFQLSRTNLESLIQGGVTALQSRPAEGTYVVKAVTTVTSGEAFFQLQRNVDIADFIIADLETDLNREFRGQSVGVTVRGCRTVVPTKLQSYADNGLLYQDENTPAFRNLSVTASGPVVQVQFEVKVAEETDFILITANVTEVTVTQ